MKLEFQEILTVPTRRLACGVALLKVDADTVFWQRKAGDPSCCIGSKKIGHLSGDGILIRARLDGVYTSPRDLAGKRVFYRFYRDTDRSGKSRPYLYLRHSTDEDPVYRGTRCVLLAKNGAFLLPEREISDALYQWIGTTGRRPKYLPSHVMGIPLDSTPPSRDGNFSDSDMPELAAAIGRKWSAFPI